MNSQSPFTENFASIKVIGVGGGGQNAVERMIEEGTQGVEFIVINTDQQALHRSSAPKRVRIEDDKSKGLGAGGKDEAGQRAAEESMAELEGIVADADMVFITAGMGGGTGSGAAPVLAEAAVKAGSLVIAVVTMPFATEGEKRRNVAERALERLEQFASALIVVENDQLLEILDKKASIVEAFRTADEVLKQGVIGLSDMITTEGEINLDFADITTVLEQKGAALMAIGRGIGDNRATEAAEQVTSSLLLNSSIEGATAVAYNIKAKNPPLMQEIHEIATAIKDRLDSNAQIFQGWALDPDLGDEIHVTLLATGIPQERRTSVSSALTQALATPRARTRQGGRKEVESMPVRPASARQTSGLPSFLSDS